MKTKASAIIRFPFSASLSKVHWTSLFSAPLSKVHWTFFIFVTGILPAFSQVDTLWWRQREPTYYYWDDHYAERCGGACAGVNKQCGAMIVARYCYIDTCLRVIGAAAPITRYFSRTPYSLSLLDTVWSHRVAEYFMLYEATDSSFDLLAQARYDTTTPRYRMHFPAVDPDSTQICVGAMPLEQNPLVYEAYFDKPIVVRDSFYVAATYNNNDAVYNEDSMCYIPLPYDETVYYRIGGNGPCQEDYDLFKMKFTNPYDRTEDLSEYHQHLRQLYGLGWFWISQANGLDVQYMPLFPIFDTTGLDIHGYRWYGECDTVRRLRLLRTGEGNAYISWAADTAARWWEVSYGPSGITPEEGLRDTLQTSLACIRDLHPGTEYVAYVRGRCKDDTRSPWSNPIAFSLSDNGAAHQPDQTMVDRNTHIMPNPTRGIATVFSSFRISTIEIYNTGGALVKTLRVNSNGAEIDATNLAAGTYIIRVRTAGGDTAKRLVKK